MAEMMRKGLGGMGKMGADMPKGEIKGKSEMKPSASEEPMGEEKTSTITHHADGSHTSQMDGAEEHHPDHLHLMAHIGHHLTGGDAHHVMQHDGMEEHHHSVEESGEHHDGELHGQEMQHEQPMEEHQMAPSYGGM